MSHSTGLAGLAEPDMKVVISTFDIALLVAVGGLCAACGSDGPIEDPTAVRAYGFGPFEVAPGEEVDGDCVQISLNNDDYLFINAVELTTGPGFHHSNWLFVPEHVFAGDDGTYTCKDRNYNEATAGILGGVLFAQSTQAPHEIQAFPAGAVIRIPPRSKIVAQIHLLNPTDQPLTITPDIKLTPILESDVTKVLAGISFQNQALALPANMSSRFTVECDLRERHNVIFGRDPDFKIYYALAHYHDLATRLTLEAVTPDGDATTIYSTENNVGDVLGGPLDPLFDMTGYTRLRMSCDYTNPRAEVVRWGVGNQEMCVFLAFSDSPYVWGGGVNQEGEPQNPLLVGTTMTYTNPCVVIAGDASH
ncbi:MAG: hypothetical protein JWP01_1592 [Myxococcales bacterium]|nr:hypothetical protein [Myxococcales bacterium]